MLAACIGGSSCTNVGEIASPDEVLTLLASPSRLPADGFSVTLLTAEIASTADERFRDIVFSTTMGRFPASAVGGQRTITVTADSGGRAVVELQASQIVGIANVSAEIRDGDAVKVSRSLGVLFESVPRSKWWPFVSRIHALPRTAQPRHGSSRLSVARCRWTSGRSRSPPAWAPLPRAPALK